MLQARRPLLRRLPRVVCVPGHPRLYCRLQGTWMAGTLHAKAASGVNIHADMIDEAQSCRSIAAVIENKGIVRAFEVYGGPAVLLGDDNIIQRITTDREINAAAAVVDPNDIVAVALGNIDRGIITRYLDVIVTGAARHRRRSADLDHLVASATIDDGILMGPHVVPDVASRHIRRGLGADSAVTGTVSQ